MRGRRLVWRLVAANVAVIAAALASFTLIAAYATQHVLTSQVEESLSARARLLQRDVRALLIADRIDDLRGLCADLGGDSATRVTVIAPDGRVLADSWRDATGMENHASRDEVRAALTKGYGRAVRRSASTGWSTMYVAVPVRADGHVIAVLRTATPVRGVENAIGSLLRHTGAIALLILFVSGALSLLASRRITRPLAALKSAALRIAQGDLAARMPVPRTEELRDVALVVNRMAGDLEDRVGMVLRQAGEREAMLAGMVEGVLAIDTDARLLDINRSGAAMLDISAVEARGCSVRDIVRNEALLRFVEQTLDGTAPPETVISAADAGDRHLRAHGSVLRDAQGAVLGALVVVHDVTELRALETMRRDFVANVSHELRTPITSIKGFVETLLDGAIEQPEDARRFLGIVARQADRLNAIIEDLLSLSRIERGVERNEIELRPGSVREVLQSAMQTCLVEARARSMTMHLEARDELRASVNAHLLEQAVINLINNAIRYSEPGGDIFLTAAAEDAHVSIHVRDYGCGIEPAHLPRLFERFYRIDKARSREQGGTGLGLAIVKHIVAAHHGDVRVESTVGSGSTFTILLPR
jgi:two-component system, OmpR family, phosphate regulon sensor histidine kinase PhoR